MKTLEQIKNDYSITQCYTDWNDMVYDLGYDNPSRLLRIIDEVMKIYAMECLKLASENAIVFFNEDFAEVCKESITNENNIIK